MPSRFVPGGALAYWPSKRRLLALGVGVATFVGAKMHAQEPRGARAPSYVHESWTVRDGLPVNSINAIIQDRTGYIWAATYDGLVRFDGVRFTVFNSANTDGLPSNRIVKLREGGDGSLWLATEQGRVVRFRDGRFSSARFAGGNADQGVTELFASSTGDLWVATTRGLWTPRGDTLMAVVPNVYAATIVERRDRSVWVGTVGRGLFRIADGGVEAIVTSTSIDSDTITTLFEDPTGTLWIGASSGVWQWRAGTPPTPVTASGRAIRVTRIARVPATGTIYFQADDGTHRFENGQIVLERTPGVPSFTLGVWADSGAIWTVSGFDVRRNGQRLFTLSAQSNVTAVQQDREGSLWIGTQRTGLHRLKPAVFTVYTFPDTGRLLNAYSTYVDRAGTVWAGTLASTPGLIRIDPSGEHVPSPVRPEVGNVTAYAEDQSGRLLVGAEDLWACTVPALMCRAEGPAELRRGRVYALYRDSSGVWVGAGGGLFYFDGSRWASLTQALGIPSATVRAFATTRDGAVWMGTNGGGLARYQAGRFTRLTTADGLPSDLIRALYADADGRLWVGTEGRGLARIDIAALGAGRPSTQAIVRIGTEAGLFDEVIHQILEDDAGRLWMNTNRGIFWVSRAELNAFADGRTSQVHSTAYSERDGLRNPEGNGGVQPAGAKGPDGRLWFPTQDGVAVVDPKTVRGNRTPPPVVVEQVVAGSRRTRLPRDSVSLARDQRDAQIEYTALTFLQPSNVRFRYRLDNYDREWVDVGSRRTAFYTKLPPGRYTFRVEATDAAGEWREPGASLAIQVLPQVWETAAFRIGAFVTLGVVIILGLRWRDARFRERAAHLERVVDERTATLRKQERELAEQNRALQSLDEAKTRFFANVSHELRTPLTLTIGPLEDLRTRATSDPTAERWIDVALRNSRRLLRLVNQLLDVAKLDAGAMTLDRKPLDVASFTRGIVSAFESVAERKGIRLTCDVPDKLVGAFDQDAIEKILTNLVSNAIKFTPGQAQVHVRLAERDGAVHWMVSDTGPGIPAAQLSHVFERFFRVDESTTRSQPGTGIGLSLVKELLELHGGRIAVESDGTGTTFTASMPLTPATLAEEALGASSDGGADRAVSDVGITTEHDSQRAVASGDEPSDDVPTLLVVDDSADLRAFIRDHFAPRFRVLEAADGAEGIELARRHLPDLVVSDVMMPRTDGHELVRALRASEETDFLAIILLTAQAGDADRLAGLERGADDYIVKPFEMRELDVRVRNLIAARRRLRERFASQRTDTPPEVETAAALVVPAAASVEDQAYGIRVRTAILHGIREPDFGVGELADAVAQDRTHLFRRVRDVFGESPSDLIRRMRLEEGARLLRTESGTVTDIGYAVGFNSVSHFCRRFAEVYGVSPAAYRAQQVVSSTSP